MYLAGDIGGTKTVLALFTRDGGPHRPVAEGRYNSSEYDSLVDLVAGFIDENAPSWRA